jgi:hypothetical protein
MRSRTRGLVVLVVLAVAVVVAVVVARGGDDGGGTEVTHAQLVQRANAICAELARKNRALEAPPKPYDDQSAAFFTSVGDNVKAAEEDLDALDPPSQDSRELDRLVDLYDQVGVGMQKLETAAAVEQGQEIETVLGEVDEVVGRMAASEQALGICAGDTSARASIGVNLRRSRPNPLSETGPLGQ